MRPIKCRWNFFFFFFSVSLKNDTAEKSLESLVWGILSVGSGRRMPSAESLILPIRTAVSCQQCSDVDGQVLLSDCEI